MLHVLPFHLDNAMWEAKSFDSYPLQTRTKNTLFDPRVEPAVADIIVLKHSIYSEKSAGQIKRGREDSCQQNSHLGNKNRVLIGTVSSHALEPRAGNVGQQKER